MLFLFRSCLGNPTAQVSEVISRRHWLTADDLVIWIFPSSCPLSHGIPWALGVKTVLWNLDYVSFFCLSFFFFSFWRIYIVLSIAVTLLTVPPILHWSSIPLLPWTLIFIWEMQIKTLLEWLSSRKKNKARNEVRQHGSEVEERAICTKLASNIHACALHIGPQIHAHTLIIIMLETIRDKESPCHFSLCLGAPWSCHPFSLLSLSDLTQWRSLLLSNTIWEACSPLEIDGECLWKFPLQSKIFIPPTSHQKYTGC